MADREIPPHVFVIFGATGDLARRKLMPALYHLTAEQERDGAFAVLGVSRKADVGHDQFLAETAAAMQQDGLSGKDVQAWCQAHLRQYALSDSSNNSYRGLGERIQEIEAEYKLPGNRVFYLALPASVFPETIERLGDAGLNRSDGWTRLVIEKPFGHDLGSSQRLNDIVHRHFDEDQVFRIDHYLGKETVQNLMIFRFANVVLESLWNRDRVASVQITVAEQLGVEGRAGYYDKTGALRDMVQNHITQLVSLIGMEAPASFSAEAVRLEKVKLLSAVSPIGPEDVVLGQYGRGRLDGGVVPGYRDERGVAADTQTETFVAMKLYVDTWRWHGVPFYIRTGKRMKRRLTQIVVTFKSPPVFLFRSLGVGGLHPNALVLTLQPDEGFALFLEVKEPTEPLSIRTVPLHFRYSEAFGEIPDAYQTLLYDVLVGDHTLFVHADETDASWRLYTPLLRRRHAVHPYAVGSWGPRQADQLLARDGMVWHNPEEGEY